MANIESGLARNPFETRTERDEVAVRRYDRMVNANSVLNFNRRRILGGVIDINQISRLIIAEGEFDVGGFEIGIKFGGVGQKLNRIAGNFAVRIQIDGVRNLAARKAETDIVRRGCRRNRIDVATTVKVDARRIQLEVSSLNDAFIQIVRV